MINPWDELDLAALANLCDADYVKFKDYKSELQLADIPWEDAREILSGFIWECIENDGE